MVILTVEEGGIYVMLHGYDFSHHQSDKVFREYLDRNPDFVILKATEGRSWVDDKFIERAVEVVKRGIMLGAYHFARPDNGNYYADEVKNFQDTLLRAQLRQCRCFLDVEGKAIGYGNWCKNWLSEFAKECTYPIGLYCSLSVAKNQLKDIAKNYPLWIAHYTIKDKDSGCAHYDGEIITQWTSNPVDTNVAIEMSEDEWYGVKSHIRGDEAYEELLVTERESKLIKYIRENW